MPGTTLPPESSGERIEEIDVSTEMQNSYVDYALSVIHSRALPDARDGLKPVQRRILFQMNEMGLTPDKGHVKSARIVGEVMGKLHPHGDAAIYDALVRLARPFAMSVPLIDGHGNFGSLDDGPAAPRYTEARLARPALYLTEDIDEDVVDFVPNYDNQYQQPAVLPAAFPNLIVNGSTGIAVGMATNMAPHNPVEALNAARYLLEHPRATVDDLMRFLPGPDLPSGGSILGLDGVKQAYETGRGSFMMRARMTLDHLTARKRGFVVTELPFMVGPESVIEKIKDGVNSKKIVGISNVQDLTDRHHGLKMVIELKTGFDPEAVKAALYRYTPLETSFGINSVVLVNGQPQTLGLVELLRVYLDHRISVVRRRSAFRLEKATQRLHLVEGLLIAILDIDEVIAVIRSSESSDEARTRLMKVFDLSTTQADHILELRLRRLTKFSQIDLEAERDSLQTQIAELTDLLSHDEHLKRQVGREFQELAEKFAVPRRTILLEGAAAERMSPVSGTAEVADTPCTVVLSCDGHVVATDRLELVAEPRSIVVGGEIRGGRRSKHDAIRALVPTTTRSSIGAVTTSGRCIRVSVVDIPMVPSGSVLLSAGPKIEAFLGLAPSSERVVGLVPLDGDEPIALGTRAGVVKRVQPDFPDKQDFELIALRDGDSVVGASVCSDHSSIVFVTSDAQLLWFGAASVRAQGRQATGMSGIRIAEDAAIISFGVVAHPEQSVVTTVAVSDNALEGADFGSAKTSPLSEFPAKGRATGGVRAQRFLRGETRLSIAWVGEGIPLANDAKGGPVELPPELLKRDASGSALTAVIASVGVSLRSLRAQ